MTTQSILANYDAMGSMSTGLRGAGSTTREELQALTNSLQALRSSWEGDAQAEFDSIMATWNRSIDEFCACVDDTAVHVDRSSQSYNETDQHNKGYFVQG